ncbi:hypothetical protein [Nocardioides sp.]|uniref:hypothetical protein n=1 Tax=Nocardioides sp. TaxID=35761 RepID=UPI003D0A303C
MSGQLSHPEPIESEPRADRPARRRLLADILAILATSLVVGVVAGFVWERIWTPPTGAAFQGKWILDGDGLPKDFSSTGIYVLVAVVAGLLVGTVTSLAFDHDEVVTLAAIVVGSLVATAVMWWVGTTLGPPDPAVLAKTADDFEPIVGDLGVSGKGAFCALPFGAVLSAAAVFFFKPPRRGPGPR